MAEEGLGPSKNSKFEFSNQRKCEALVPLGFISKDRPLCGLPVQNLMSVHSVVFCDSQIGPCPIKIGRNDFFTVTSTFLYSGLLMIFSFRGKTPPHIYISSTLVYMLHAILFPVGTPAPPPPIPTPFPSEALRKTIHT